MRGSGVPKPPPLVTQTVLRLTERIGYMRNAIRSFIHGFISWYLNRVGRAFHVHPWGIRGRYVVIMTESQYHEFREKVFWPSEKAVEQPRALDAACGHEYTMTLPSGKRVCGACNAELPRQ